MERNTAWYSWDSQPGWHRILWWRETARNMNGYARYYREEYEISAAQVERLNAECVKLRAELVEARDLLAESADTIDGLADQQAMGCSWWKASRTKIRIYLDSLR
jgi:hypothetical protein